MKARSSITSIELPIYGVAAYKPLPRAPLCENLRERLGPLEAVGADATAVVATKPFENFHPLIAAADLAFRHHYPLRLTPDHLWLPIAQGIGQHINLHAESLRSRFVTHSGQERIVIRRDEFRLHSPNNDWAGCLEEFNSELTSRANPELAALISCNFSTIGPVESAASQAVLMDALSAYFEYVVHTLCGIPEIQLAGTTTPSWRNWMMRNYSCRN